jgi:hypothetical protein
MTEENIASIWFAAPGLGGIRFQTLNNAKAGNNTVYLPANSFTSSFVTGGAGGSRATLRKQPNGCLPGQGVKESKMGQRYAR